MKKEIIDMLGERIVILEIVKEDEQQNYYIISCERGKLCVVDIVIEEVVRLVGSIGDGVVVVVFVIVIRSRKIGE